MGTHAPRLILAGILALGSLLATAAAPLKVEDVRWLNRVTYGLDTPTVARYRALGRKGFLDEQLRGGPDRDPALVAVIGSMTITRKPALQLVQEAEAENRRLQGLATDEARQQGRQAQNQLANEILAEATRRHLLRALYSPDQLQEQMTWFWLNHFSVFHGKGNVRWTLADYEERAIRPHALGRFRDLLLATMTHPAMLVYLDNAQSAAGKVNENYARELLELHTLGVDGGYTQQDVQELARLLTGLGLDAGAGAPRLRPELRPFYVRDGLFAFHPGRHDFGPKTLLGRTFQGEGLPEAEKLADLLAAHPATAAFVSRKLAAYFLGDDPPKPLVARMARTFLASGGDLRAVLRVLLEAREASGPLDSTFKDPVHYVLFALRLAYDGKRPLNMRPVAAWLNQLGEPLYGRVTPDGYPLGRAAWSSPGQLVKRFEIARALGAGNAGLFAGDDPSETTGFPLLTNRLFYEVLEPNLSPAARQALDRAASQQEWNLFLLASPDFMTR